MSTSIAIITHSRTDLAAFQSSIPALDRLPAGLAGAIVAWAYARTSSASPRWADMMHDRCSVVGDFFDFVQKAPPDIRSKDVIGWQAALRERRLAPATIYAQVSRVSSFFRWCMKDEASRLAQAITENPCDQARPKAPKAYQTDSTKALSDDEARRLLAHVKSLADSGDVIGKRDYALLVFYFDTGMRRREVMQLRWGDLTPGDPLTVRTQFKGGQIRTRQINSPRVQVALAEYIQASGRSGNMRPDSPLWISHSAIGERGKETIGITSRAFVERLKTYAAKVGLGHIHLHQTRHTYARIVAEQSKSLADTQEALGHANPATTRVYVPSIAEQVDRFGEDVARRLKV